jgi:hypothetical protein
MITSGADSCPGELTVKQGDLWGFLGPDAQGVAKWAEEFLGQKVHFWMVMSGVIIRLWHKTFRFLKMALIK